MGLGIQRCLLLVVFMAFVAIFTKPAAGQEVGVYNLTAQGVNGSTPTITTVTLPGGLYRFTLITPLIDVRATYTAWNPYGSGPYWSTPYGIGFAQVPGGPVTSTGGGQFTFSDTPQNAWLATTNKSVKVDIPFGQGVQLYVADSVYSDNAGGVSVLVELV